MVLVEVRCRNEDHQANPKLFYFRILEVEILPKRLILESILNRKQENQLKNRFFGPKRLIFLFLFNSSKLSANAI